MKFTNYQKTILFRAFLYLFIFVFLVSIPIIYKLFFINYGIEMFLFLNPVYMIGELGILSSIIFWFEYYYSFRKKLEIKNKLSRIKLIGWSVFLIFVLSKLLFLSYC
ncbi:MAG: hypothetical protein mread185_000674 [Mycoplasmataceae bacterium]|nr:MAG: hypothetical protein mread185_000674 [Mycoplasmataceae bacterium]